MHRKLKKTTPRPRMKKYFYLPTEPKHFFKFNTLKWYQTWGNGGRRVLPVIIPFICAIHLSHLVFKINLEVAGLSLALFYRRRHWAPEIKVTYWRSHNSVCWGNSSRQIFPLNSTASLDQSSVAAAARSLHLRNSRDLFLTKILFRCSSFWGRYSEHPHQ